MPEIYTPVDMDMLDSAGLYSVQRDLDVLIVSDNNTALRQYLSKKTLQGAVSAESIQDLMAATLINSVYDDEANTILVGGSGGNGGFAYGGDWDATSSETTEIATFNVPDNSIVSSNQLAVISGGVGFGATVTNLSHTANTGTLHYFRVTVPDTSGGGLFFVGIHNSGMEGVYSALSDTTATVRGVAIQAGNTFSFSRDADNVSNDPLPYPVEAGDVLKVGYRSDISAVYIYNETQSNIQLIGGNFISGFGGLEHLSVFCNGAGSSLSFNFADDYPIYQSVFNLNYPEDLTKTYRVSAANANSALNSKLLKAADFVDFITNEDDEVVDVVVSRLVSDSNIRDTISTALNDTTSSVYTQTQSLGGTAGLDSVVSALNEATNDNPSNLTTSLDNFLVYLLANEPSLFYEAFQTQVQAAVDSYIQDNVQIGGTIYEAIAQYVSDSTTGVAGHTIIQSAIEASLDNYANAIGVGNNGQLYLDVVEAAQATISNEIQSGGIIDTAIQAAINP